jgi:hypothetical protein
MGLIDRPALRTGYNFSATPLKFGGRRRQRQHGNQAPSTTPC